MGAGRCGAASSPPSVQTQSTLRTAPGAKIDEVRAWRWWHAGGAAAAHGHSHWEAVECTEFTRSRFFNVTLTLALSSEKAQFGWVSLRTNGFHRSDAPMARSRSALRPLANKLTVEASNVLAQWRYFFISHFLHVTLSPTDRPHLVCGGIVPRCSSVAEIEHEFCDRWHPYTVLDRWRIDTGAPTGRFQLPTSKVED